MVLPVLIPFAVYIIIGKELVYSLCPSVMILGIPCPGCGMTRAMFAFLRGDWILAWNYHPFLYVLIIFVAIFCVRRYLLLKDVRCMIKWLIAIAMAMILFYVYRMITLFPNQTPMTYYYGSYFYQILKRI